jgi:hypothetical protein
MEDILRPRVEASVNKLLREEYYYIYIIPAVITFVIILALSTTFA